MLADDGTKDLSWKDAPWQLGHEILMDLFICCYNAVHAMTNENESFVK